MSQYEDADLLLAKRQVLQAVVELNDDQQTQLEKWINSQQYRQDVKNFRELNNQDRHFDKIARDLRAKLGIEGEVKSENVRRAVVGDLADCAPQHTLHVDEFICDDRQLEELVSEGVLSRHYCTSCDSRKVKELTVISHSAGRRYLRFMYKYLLPSQLQGLQLLDIGSRIGAVLYGAYYLTDISKIIGVELNKELCDIQESCINKFKMDRERIRVVHSDLMKEGELVQTSDIIVFNVPDLFVEESLQVEMWRLLKSKMKRGAMLITMRSVAETLSALDVFHEFENWLDIQKPHQIENEIYITTEDDDCTEVFLYKVK